MTYTLERPAKTGKTVFGHCEANGCARCPGWSENGCNATKTERGKVVPNRVTFCAHDCHNDSGPIKLSAEKGPELLASEVNVVITSDLSGEPGASTVAFGLDGLNYEIDLTPDEQAELRDRLAIFVGHARQGKRKASAKKSVSLVAGTTPRAIRQWAKDQGMDVPDRGRLPKSLVQAYEAAKAAPCPTS